MNKKFLVLGVNDMEEIEAAFLHQDLVGGGAQHVTAFYWPRE